MPDSQLPPDNANHGPTLEARNVSRVFMARKGLFADAARLVAVDGVTFSLARGERLGLVGESGCGKSTLGRLACGLLPTSSGEILLHGRKLGAAGSHSWGAGKIQMVFQDPASSLNPRMKVRASVAEPLLALGESSRNSREKADALLETVGLGGMGDRYPHQFSGGQRQRIAIARALITKPDVIICDEPVSALDASVQAQILNLLKEMDERVQYSCLFISHDLAVIGFMCPRILVMYLGQIVEEAERDNLFGHPAHPYTHALVAAMPRGAALWEKGYDIDAPPAVLKGELPSPLNPPSGCYFHPRCPRAEKICSTQAPAWKELSPAWRVRCHFPLL